MSAASLKTSSPYGSYRSDIAILIILSSRPGKGVERKKTGHVLLPTFCRSLPGGFGIKVNKGDCPAPQLRKPRSIGGL